MPPSFDPTDVVARVCEWYAHHGRDLPWRTADCTPWGVLVSEIMLQQTPVARVLGPWQDWMRRWPTPTDLAAAPTSEVLRAWGRLGYPRRALRLQAAAMAIAERHNDRVPHDVAALRALPGVGEYTAAAVASFAFGQRHAVMDTNVRRVVARLHGEPGTPAHATRAERDRVAALLPDDDATAAVWAVASMELGALVCKARTPECGRCPVAEACAWRAAGHPGRPPTRTQAWKGTDRQCRGRIMALLRDSEGPVALANLAGVGVDAAQVERCWRSLVADGLAVVEADGLQLPGA